MSAPPNAAAFPPVPRRTQSITVNGEKYPNYNESNHSAKNKLNCKIVYRKIQGPTEIRIKRPISCIIAISDIRDSVISITNAKNCTIYFENLSETEVNLINLTDCKVDFLRNCGTFQQLSGDKHYHNKIRQDGIPVDENLDPITKLGSFQELTDC